MVTRRRSPGELAWNVFATYGLSIFWVIIAIAVLKAALGQGSVFAQFPKVSVIFSWLPHFPQVEEVLAKNFGLSIFMTLAFAPFVEEAIFRMLPLTFVVGRHPDKVRAVVIVICGIFFGMAHGHPLKVFIQGFLGMMLGFLYVKNHNSQFKAYISCVIVHAMYNYTILMVSVLG